MTHIFVVNCHIALSSKFLLICSTHYFETHPYNVSLNSARNSEAGYSSFHLRSCNEATDHKFLGFIG